MNEELENVQGTEEKTGTEDMHQAKTFTQDEVDNIIEKRLARERKKFSGILAGKEPRELELDEREKVVKKREMQINARTLLTEQGIPEEAMELLNYEDDEKLQESIETLKNVIDNSSNKRLEKILKGGNPLKKAPENEPIGDLRGAFGLRK